MPTDAERREVARRLRGIKDTREGCGHDMCCDLWSAIFDSDYRCTDLCDECEVAVLNSLADLIEPVDPTERGIDSIYDWCFAAIEGADGAEDELFCSIMRAIEDYRHPELATAYTVRAVDRDALLALADEMDKWALTCDHYDRRVSPLDVTRYARRIRESCGVVA